MEIDLGDLGFDPSDIPETDEFPFVITPWHELLRATFLNRAKSWVGHLYRDTEHEQCANFVRRVAREAGLILPVAERPFDLALTRELPQGPAFANSFFSVAGGRLLGFGDLRSGDLVAFRDTYQGEFPAGCITHVGIWFGDGIVIDRPTAGEPVRELVLDDWWRERFVVGWRPQQFEDA